MVGRRTICAKSIFDRNFSTSCFDTHTPTDDSAFTETRLNLGQMRLCWHVADWRLGNQRCRFRLSLTEPKPLAGSETQSMTANGTKLPFQDVRYAVATGGKPEIV
jgi:hypothetical protein